MSGATLLFAGHPRLGQVSDRRSLLAATELDDALLNQINLSGAPYTFLVNLIDTLGDYGALADGRDALESLLIGLKDLVGSDRAIEVERLLLIWRRSRESGDGQSSVASRYLRYLMDRWLGLDSPLLPRDQRMADVVVGLQVIDHKDDPVAGAIPNRPEHGAFKPLVGEAKELLAAMDASDDVHRWLLLGDPGTGKTTLVTRVAAQMAEDALLTSNSLVPAVVPLSEVAVRLAREPGFSVFEFLSEVGSALGIQNLGDEFRRLSRRGRVVFFFDGMDEVPESIRSRILDLVRAGTNEPAGNRSVLTSRRIGAGRFEGFRRLEIAPLKVADQRSLMLALCGPEKTQRLLAEISGRPDVQDMARVPMMLTVLALVARESPELRGDFLRRHSDLFRLAARLLLEGRHRDQRGVADSYRAERVLAEISLTLHRLGPAGEGEEVFSDTEVERAVAACAPEDLIAWRNVREFIEDISTVSNIIFAVDPLKSKYRYLHRTIREYFAAARMAGMPSQQRRLAVAEVVGQQQWAEVLVLLGGLVPDVDDYLHQLFAGPPDLALRALKEVHDLRPETALDILSLRSSGLRARRRVFVDLVRRLPSDALVDVLWAYTDGLGADLPRADVYFINDALGSLDTELARSLQFNLFRHMSSPADSLFSLPESLDSAGYWCRVAPGDCFIGAAIDDPERPAWVAPLRRVSVPEFHIGRVPITNAIYEQFDPAHRLVRDFQEELVARDLDHHPAVGISWYEAEAFCQWARQVFSDVRMPTEIEWEKAASWGGESKFRFPWGNDWDANRLNTWESGPNRTTAVGSYPLGASPVGALDMAGNVWEWCIDWFSDDAANVEPTSDWRSIVSTYPNIKGDRRVDRGGGWYHDVGRPATFLRAADDPADRFSHCGFRVVRSEIQVVYGLDIGAAY